MYRLSIFTPVSNVFIENRTEAYIKYMRNEKHRHHTLQPVKTFKRYMSKFIHVCSIIFPSALFVTEFNVGITQVMAPPNYSEPLSRLVKALFEGYL
jgi:hypothetical protein